MPAALADDPLVSIAMPVRNNRATLGVAIRSILAQTHKNWELLLIDDGSTDGTPEVARRYAEADGRIRYFRDGQAAGLPDRLNQAVALSRGPLMARMDGDDVAYPERLARQSDYLRRHPEVDLVGAWAMVFGPDGRPLGKRIGPEHHEEICARPTAGFPLIHPTYLGKVEFFRSYGYRAAAIRCEDQDLLIRSFARRDSEGQAGTKERNLRLHDLGGCRFANVPEILLGYREESLKLQKLWGTRRHFAASLFSEFRQRGQTLKAVMAVAEQAAKAAVDGMAVGTGLNYRLLRHRARPTSDAERARWDRLRRELRLGTDAGDSHDPGIEEYGHAC